MHILASLITGLEKGDWAMEWTMDVQLVAPLHTVFWDFASDLQLAESP